MPTRFESITISRTEAIDLWVTDCPICGVIFAMPKRLEQARRQDKGSFYCPNGHSMSFTQTEAERVRREMQAAIERAQQATAEWRDDYSRVWQEREAEKRSHAATKGKLTKTLKRVNAGVCPHCNRTFQALSKHMQSKHKDAAAGEGATG